jgi:hypothetical protein
MAKIYNFSKGTEYFRRSQYTAFLQNQYKRDINLLVYRTGKRAAYRHILGWKKTMLHAYKQDGASCKYVLSETIIWTDIENKIRKSPETYCTEHMAFLIGIRSRPPSNENYGKIIPFSTSQSEKK